MQFDFEIARACGLQGAVDGSPEVVRVEEAALQHQRWGAGLRDLLDAVGERSRRAQGLGKAVTCGRSSMLVSNNVYLLVAGNSVLGLLKTGPKKLFIAKGQNDGLVEINPQCVLDFYIVEGKQRSGLGRFLFEEMLGRERVVPEKLAYDRPSPKLLGFLRKHYGLSRYVPQNNNFVVFDSYFSGNNRAPARALESRPKPSLASLPSEPEAPAARLDPRENGAMRRHGSRKDSQQKDRQQAHAPASAAAAPASAAVSAQREDPRDEAVAAGMPSGGRRRLSSGPGDAAALGGRQSCSGEASEMPANHAERMALRQPCLRT